MRDVEAVEKSLSGLQNVAFFVAKIDFFEKYKGLAPGNAA
jgi:hypothetical protein